MDRWQGKVAVVTGASAGIGASIAEKLVDEGMIVVGLARRVEKIEELASQLGGRKGKLYAFKADVANEQDVIDAFKWTERLGPVHVLVNNAGIVRNTNLIDGNTKMWREVFDVNVIGLCVATREAVRNMIANKVDGHIVHINSIAGHTVQAGNNVYGASKFAVTNLTETLRQELIAANTKIKISSINPGVVGTEILTSLPDEFRQMIEAYPRLLPEDIANGVVYVLGTPPHVQIHDLTIKPVGELF